MNTLGVVRVKRTGFVVHPVLSIRTSQWQGHRLLRS
jgi:hypothetical protein